MKEDFHIYGIIPDEEVYGEKITMNEMLWLFQNCVEVRPISKEKTMKDFDAIPRLMYQYYPKGPFSGPFFEIFMEQNPDHIEHESFELKQIF